LRAPAGHVRATPDSPAGIWPAATQADIAFGNGRLHARDLAEEGRYGEMTHSGRMELPIGNSKFKIQDDLRLEISERSQEVNHENGKSKPRPPMTNRELAIVNRQIAIGRIWAPPGLRNERILFLYRPKPECC